MNEREMPSPNNDDDTSNSIPAATTETEAETTALPSSSSVKAGYNNGLKKRGGHSTKQDPSKVDTTGERVIEPRQVDVLCGRGGMSNHHPGNEWYRRLIRSNRPLYRACPKHTKLLVAKAIVQAVEQQDGRFLERDLRTGFWYPVPYKRAVDKTSQGLRERDRDEMGQEDEETGGRGSESKSDEEYTADGTKKPFTIPESFSGKSKNPPNLRVLAQVAIDRANRDQPPPSPSIPLAVAVAATVASFSHKREQPYQQQKQHHHHHQQQQQQQPPGMSATVPTATATLATPAADRRIQNVYAALQRPSPPPPSVAASLAPDLAQQAEAIVRQTLNSAITTPLNHGVSRTSSSASTVLMMDHPSSSRATTASDDDLMPLPPSMQIRASSMFRMLKHTQLLPKPSDLPKRSLPMAGGDKNKSSNNNKNNNSGEDDGDNSSIVEGSQHRHLPLNAATATGMAPSLSPYNTNVYLSQQHQQPPYASEYGAVGPSGSMFGMYSNSVSSTTLHAQNRNQYTAQQQQQYQSQLSTVEAPLHGSLQSSMMPPGQQQQQQHHANFSVNGHGQIPQSQHKYNQSQHHHRHQHHRQHQQSTGHYQQHQSLLDMPNHSQTNNNAPALTRFTSQVSDWLNSFWPTDNPNHHQPTSSSTTRPTSLLSENATSIQQTNVTEAASVNVSHDVSSSRTEEQGLPSLSLAWGCSSASSMTLPLASAAAAAAADVAITVATTTVAPYSSSSSSRKRKAQASLPRLPYGVQMTATTGNHSDAENDPSRNGGGRSSGSGSTTGMYLTDASPTELEQSVSATLLKMAGAPSKLFSGLTSFFADRGVSTLTNAAAAAAAAAATPMTLTASQPPTTTAVGGTFSLSMVPPPPPPPPHSTTVNSLHKKSQSSLLDDYDESPMEARLRTVQ